MTTNRLRALLVEHHAGTRLDRSRRSDGPGRVGHQVQAYERMSPDDRRDLLIKAGIRVYGGLNNGVSALRIYVPAELWERLGAETDLTPEEREAKRSAEQASYRASLGIE